jgi:4-amino-4-deoxy-L-arabinose transferase-like glycosyltransferase
MAHITVAFGLAIRIAALSRVGGRHLYYENLTYDVMGFQLLAGTKFDTYWPPGVPYYLAFFHWIFGPGMLVARASMLLVYVGFSYVLYTLVQRFASTWAANLAVLVFALYPAYVRYAFNPSTEYPTAMCLAAIALLAVDAARKRSWWAAAVLGLVLGVLALVRANSLGLMLAAPLWLWFRTRKAGLALVVLLVAAVPVSAWLLKAYTMTGRFVMINDSNAENFFQSNNRWTPLYNTCVGGPVDWMVPPEFTKLANEIECKPAAERQPIYRRIALEHITSRPDLFLLRSFNRFRAFFCFPIHHGELSQTAKAPTIVGHAITALELGFFYWPIMVLAILFWFAGPLPAVQADAHAVLGVLFVYAVPFFLTCSQSRYNFPIVPLCAVFAVAFVDSVRERSWGEMMEPLRKSAWRRRALYTTLAFFFYIQVEWMWIVAQAANQSRLA